MTKNSLLSILLSAFISAETQRGCVHNRENVIENNQENVMEIVPNSVYDTLISRETVEEISQCVYELEVVHNYIIDGTDFVYTLSEQYGNAIAVHIDTIGDSGRIYFLTAFHVVSPPSEDDVLSLDSIFIRNEMESTCYEVPSDLNLDYLNSSYTLFFNLQNRDSISSITVLPITLDIYDILLNEDEDIALMIAELNNAQNNVNFGSFDVCSRIGDDAQLYYGNELVTSSYVFHELMIDYGIYSGSFQAYMSFSSIISSNIKLIPGYSGGGVFALREGVPELVAVMNMDWMGKGMVVPISSVRDWLEEIDLGYILNRD